MPMTVKDLIWKLEQQSGHDQVIVTEGEYDMVITNVYKHKGDDSVVIIEVADGESK